MQCLYRHFSDSRELLYVGISVDAHKRLSQHRDSSWWDQITSVTIERFQTREEVIEAEKKAIQSERPKFNKIHNHEYRLPRIKKEKAPEPKVEPPKIEPPKITPPEPPRERLRLPEILPVLFIDPNRWYVPDELGTFEKKGREFDTGTQSHWTLKAKFELKELEESKAYLENNKWWKKIKLNIEGQKVIGKFRVYMRKSDCHDYIIISFPKSLKGGL